MEDNLMIRRCLFLLPAIVLLAAMAPTPVLAGHHGDCGCGGVMEVRAESCG